MCRQVHDHFRQTSTTLCLYKISNRISSRANFNSPRKMSSLSTNRALFLHWRLVTITVGLHIISKYGKMKTWRMYRLVFLNCLARISVELSSIITEILRDSLQTFAGIVITQATKLPSKSSPFRLSPMVLFYVYIYIYLYVFVCLFVLSVSWFILLHCQDFRLNNIEDYLIIHSSNLRSWTTRQI